MDRLREEFEEKLSHDYGDDALLKNSDGDYVDWLTADLWDYWKASRASIVVEFIEPPFYAVKKDSTPIDNIRFGSKLAIEQVRRSIGLSIKGE